MSLLHLQGIKRLHKDLEKLLKKVTAQRPLVVIIDGLDQFSDEESEALSAIPKTLAPSVKMILTTRGKDFQGFSKLQVSHTGHSMGSRTTPHQGQFPPPPPPKKMKPMHCPPGPRSIGLFPTRTSTTKLNHSSGPIPVWWGVVRIRTGTAPLPFSQVEG